MTPTPERVLQLVTHCAGRRNPPRKEDRDPTSAAIRHVVAWLLVHDGRREREGAAIYACERIEIEAERGCGFAVDLLLRTLGQIVEAEHGRLQRIPPIRRRAGRPVVPLDDDGAAPSLPAPRQRRCAPQAVNTCATPFDRAACPRERPCPRTECRYHQPVTGECALDCAQLGGMEQVQIAIHLGVTRSQVWNDENRALAKLRRRHPRLAQWLTRELPAGSGWNNR